MPSIRILHHYHIGLDSFLGSPEEGRGLVGIAVVAAGRKEEAGRREVADIEDHRTDIAGQMVAVVEGRNRVLDTEVVGDQSGSQGQDQSLGTVEPGSPYVVAHSDSPSAVGAHSDSQDHRHTLVDLRG